jgi:hypothetical protein|tara:strand:- start:1650 stop:2069 length:420 start_codon:yes stop_codon:yes gene_type:complete
MITNTLTHEPVVYLGVPSNENPNWVSNFTATTDVECNISITGAPKRASLEISMQLARQIWDLKNKAAITGEVGSIATAGICWEGGNDRFMISSSWIEVRSHSLRFCGQVGGRKSDMIVESASDFPLNAIFKHFGLAIVH